MYFAANAKPTPYQPLSGPFGNDALQVTNRMLVKNGKSWIPVMGGIHFSLVPYEKWEETLLKMKEGGIDVVASYVFWIHHEEVKGNFDFTGNRDIGRFIRLCHQQSRRILCGRPHDLRLLSLRRQLGHGSAQSACP